MYIIPEADLCCHQAAGLDCPDHCGDLQPPSSPPVPRYHRNQGSRSKYPAPKCKLHVVLSVYPLHTLGVKASFRKKKCTLYFVYLSYQICSRVTKQHQRKVFIDAIYCSIRQHGDQSTYVWEHPQNSHIHTLPVIFDTPYIRNVMNQSCVTIIFFLFRVFKIN